MCECGLGVGFLVDGGVDGDSASDVTRDLEQEGELDSRVGGREEFLGLGEQDSAWAGEGGAEGA